MSTISLQITASDLENPFTTDAKVRVRPLRNFIKAINKALSGANRNTYTMVGKSGLVAASGTITIASGSGSIAAVINGVTISVSFTTSDTNTATLLKNAINASSNALVQNHVTASSSAGVVTITAVTPGISGNTITLSATGTGATASGARLTGGTTTSVTYTF